jgi:hypothetical protein
MPFRRGREQKQRLHESKMSLDWQQRLMTAVVPKNARDLFEQLETRGSSDSKYMEQIARRVAELGDDSAMVTFGLFHTRKHNVMGIVIVVGQSSMALLDAEDGKPYAEFRWPTLCRFDVKHDRRYQIVGLAWYEGEKDIPERLGEGTALRPSEMRFAYMYMHADKETLTAIKVAFVDAAVPEELHGRPPLL